MKTKGTSSFNSMLTDLIENEQETKVFGQETVNKSPSETIPVEPTPAKAEELKGNEQNQPAKNTQNTTSVASSVSNRTEIKEKINKQLKEAKTNPEKIQKPKGQIFSSKNGFLNDEDALLFIKMKDEIKNKTNIKMVRASSDMEDLMEDMARTMRREYGEFKATERLIVDLALTELYKRLYGEEQYMKLYGTKKG